ncbi:unnamed protein product, partial [Cladocopium goreaui]
AIDRGEAALREEEQQKMKACAGEPAPSTVSGSQQRAGALPPSSAWVHAQSMSIFAFGLLWSCAWDRAPRSGEDATTTLWSQNVAPDPKHKTTASQTRRWTSVARVPMQSLEVVALTAEMADIKVKLRCSQEQFVDMLQKYYTQQLVQLEDPDAVPDWVMLSFRNELSQIFKDFKGYPKITQGQWIRILKTALQDAQVPDGVLWTQRGGQGRYQLQSNDPPQEQDKQHIELQKQHLDLPEQEQGKQHIELQKQHLDLPEQAPPHESASAAQKQEQKQNKTQQQMLLTPHGTGTNCNLNAQEQDKQHIELQKQHLDLPEQEQDKQHIELQKQHPQMAEQEQDKQHIELQKQHLDLPEQALQQKRQQKQNKTQQQMLLTPHGTGTNCNLNAQEQDKQHIKLQKQHLDLPEQEQDKQHIELQKQHPQMAEQEQDKQHIELHKQQPELAEQEQDKQHIELQKQHPQMAEQEQDKQHIELQKQQPELAEQEQDKQHIELQKQHPQMAEQEQDKQHIELQKQHPDLPEQ